MFERIVEQNEAVLYNTVPVEWKWNVFEQSEVSKINKAVVLLQSLDSAMREMSADSYILVKRSSQL